MTPDDILDAIDDLDDAKRSVETARHRLDTLLGDAFTTGVDTQAIVEQSNGRLTMSYVAVAIAMRHPEARDALFLALPEDDGSGLSLREARSNSSLSLTELLESGIGRLVREPGSISGIRTKVSLRPNSPL